MTKDGKLSVELSHDELRYLVSCGTAIVQNIPAQSLPTYCHFDKMQILEFTKRIREVMEHDGVDM